jgi:sulfate adenylyltransferase subunit 1
LRYGATSTRALVTSLDHLLDIDSLTYGPAPESLALNDIAQVTIRTADAVPVEAYRPGGAVGSLLIIDPADGTTLAAGMVGDRLAALHPETTTPAAPAAETEEDWLS